MANQRIPHPPLRGPPLPHERERVVVNCHFRVRPKCKNSKERRKPFGISDGKARDLFTASEPGFEALTPAALRLSSRTAAEWEFVDELRLQRTSGIARNDGLLLQ
jgi:hypothetical protein